MNLSHKNNRIPICILILLITFTFILPAAAHGVTKKKKKEITTPINVSTYDLEGYVTNEGLSKKEQKQGKKNIKLYWKRDGSHKLTHYIVYYVKNDADSYTEKNSKKVTKQSAVLTVSGKYYRIKVKPYYKKQPGKCGQSIQIRPKEKNITDISLNGNRFIMTRPSEVSFSHNGEQTKACDTSIKWSSSNDDVANVIDGRKSNTIRVFTYYPTKFSIIARAPSGIKKYFKATIIPLYPEKISIVPEKMYEKDVKTLSVNVSEAANRGITFSYASKYKKEFSKIASLSSSGKLKIKKTGKITVKAVAKGKYPYRESPASDTAKLYIYPQYPTSVKILDKKNNSIKKISLKKGKKTTLSPKVSEAKYMTLKWKSKDASIAKVDKNTGEITALKPGTTTITATAKSDKNKKAASANVDISVPAPPKPTKPPTSSSSNDKALKNMVKWAKAIAADDTYGYSMGLKRYSRYSKSNHNRYCHICNNTNSKDYDCASFVAAAVSHGYKLNGNICSQTGGCNSLYGLLKSYGWKDIGRIPPSQMKCGDIMINPHMHVEIFTGEMKNGFYLNVAAHDDYDGKSGDSTGRDISVSSNAWFLRHYTTVLRHY
ncbi:MAG: Ig-like domain-containing protein [Hornefia sp.]|nr:Ig-like domain-containing protein [Hornefia sp.]